MTELKTYKIVVVGGIPIESEWNTNDGKQKHNYYHLRYAEPQRTNNNLRTDSSSRNMFSQIVWDNRNSILFNSITAELQAELFKEIKNPDGTVDKELTDYGRSGLLTEAKVDPYYVERYDKKTKKTARVKNKEGDNIIRTTLPFFVDEFQLLNGAEGIAAALEDAKANVSFVKANDKTQEEKDTEKTEP